MTPDCPEILNQVCRPRVRLLWSLLFLVAALPISAVEVRYYRDERGVTWREEHRNVEEQVAETSISSQPQAVYREKYSTDTRQHQYLAYVPTTEYQWVPRWHGWWRIFEGPHLAYHLQPRTVWKSIPYTVSVPTLNREWVAETRNVQAPTSESRVKTREIVRRTPVSPGSSALAAGSWGGSHALFDPYGGYDPTRAFAMPPVSPVPQYVPAYGQAQAYGGIARLDSDPPRWANPSEGAWQMRR
jgi:hypothetical protein